MKKRTLLLTLGVLSLCQLGYGAEIKVSDNSLLACHTTCSINKSAKSEETQSEEAVQPASVEKTDEAEKTDSEALNQAQENTESEETAETPEVKPAPVRRAATSRLTPAQQKRAESKAKKEKEKNMSLSEKLDLQLIRMERMLKSLEGR